MLRQEIEKLSVRYPKYGYRRITELLLRMGYTVGYRRVARVMKSANLLVSIRRSCQTTKSLDCKCQWVNRLDQGYLVLGFLSILDEKSRFGDRSYRKSLEQKFKIIGKLNSPET